MMKKFGVIVAVLVLCACHRAATTPATGTAPTAGSKALAGTVQLDGSSTVFPISEAMGEEFQRANPGVRVTVGLSGTGGGFAKFVAKEIDIADASRPIEPAEEAKAKAANIQFIEFPIAFDGLSVVVNPANDFATTLTIEELRRIWQPGSQVKKWSDVRPAWPARDLHLYGPGTASGTFDYFTSVVVGEARASRSDYTASEDDNVLVQGIAGDKDALGYFGYAYAVENTTRVKLVAIDSGKGAFSPSVATIADRTYPLARPLFIYVNTASLARPEVEAFVKFYIEHAPQLVAEVGYVALPDAMYVQDHKRLDTKKP